jgi:putative iron-dependent peroxidase
VSLGGDNRGELLDRARSVHDLLGDGFRLEEEVTTFRYRKGHDLTGYEDGTENPQGDRAVAAAIVSGKGVGLDGSSFVAVQRFIHDLMAFHLHSRHEADAIIGRNLETNEELEDAPPTAHVKRSAQESFEPEAFMVRRSMPWGDLRESGLYFVAYGESLDRFERVLRRMAGLDDGIVDALTTFTRAVSGGYYWCPPILDGKLDLRALGI